MPLENRLIGRLNSAARELVFLAEIEGIGHLSRGGKGCVFRALEWLRPDIAKAWADQETADGLLSRFFPEHDDTALAGERLPQEER